MQGTGAGQRRGFAVDLALQPPGDKPPAALVDIAKVSRLGRNLDEAHA